MITNVFFSYIYEQLRHERIKSMALILEHTDSAYFPCFKTMFKNVVTALAESRDITLYLSPLMKHFLQFEETDFSESKPLLKPLMHVVCLVNLFLIKMIIQLSFCNKCFTPNPALGQLELLSHVIEVDRFTQANLQLNHSAGEAILRSFVDLSQRHR